MIYKLYYIIATISVLVRQFLLPNPFDPLGEAFSVTITDIVIPFHPLVLNWLAEPVLHTVIFAIVGIYYHKGRNKPTLGSFLYLLIYSIHVGLIYIISLFGFAWIALIIILVLYTFAYICINVLRYRLAH